MVCPFCHGGLVVYRLEVSQVRHGVFQCKGILVGPGDHAKVSPGVILHIREIAGPTRIEHVVETGVFVGHTHRGGRAHNGSCEPLDSVVVCSLSGFLQPSVHIHERPFNHDLPLALFGHPVWGSDVVAQVLWYFPQRVVARCEMGDPQGRRRLVRCGVHQFAAESLHPHCPELEEADNSAELVAFLLGEGLHQGMRDE